MAGLMRAIPPTLPDFHVCDPYFGHGAFPTTCEGARALLPQSNSRIVYLVHHPTATQYILPFSVSSGNCMISVEVSGPTIPYAMTYSPNQILGMADHVIDNCVVNAGVGGFVTKDISNMLSYLMSPFYNVYSIYPPSSAFLTLSVAAGGPTAPSPGNLDPIIPSAFAGYLAGAGTARLGEPASSRYLSLASIFQNRAIAMRRGGTAPWWNYLPPGSQQMSYNCDTDLGSPSTLDCSRLRYSLDNKADNIQLGQGEVKFLSSNTCHIAISATTAIVLLWEQIKAAVDALTTLCVSDPLQPPQGGRAHLNAKIKGRRSRRQRDISGLNALPPGVSVTVFQQPEPWQTDPAKEVNTCTWKAIIGQRPVESCKAS